MKIRKLLQVSSLCLYRTDIPWRIVVPIATLLSIKLFKAKREATPLTVALVIFVLFDLPILAYILSLRDYMWLFYAVALPLAAAIAFKFYTSVLTTLSNLKDEGILIESRTGAFTKFKNSLSRHCNFWPLVFIFLGVSLFTAYGIIGFTPPVAGYFYIGMYYYLTVWSCMAWFSLLFFSWKAFIIWLGIKRIAQGKAKLAFLVKEFHPDGRGGLRALAYLWLNVNYIVVIVGVYIFTYASASNNWTNPMVVFAVVAYVILAPLLFLSPFLFIHSLMVKHRDKTVFEREASLRHIQELLLHKINEPNSVDRDITTLKSAQDFLKQRFEEAKRLPTWPIDISAWRIFLASYVSPMLLFGIETMVGRLLESE